MSVLESLKTIREEAIEQLKAGKSAEELEQLRVQLLGKSGQLTGILRQMGKLAPEERAAVGAEANRVKQAVEAALNERRPAREAAAPGRLHQMTQTYREIGDALVGMGFSLFGGPEIELDEYNFTLLNLPPDHPARDMQDTFYINDNVVLRTHTSPCEIRAL